MGGVLFRQSAWGDGTRTGSVRSSCRSPGARFIALHCHALGAMQEGKPSDAFDHYATLVQRFNAVRTSGCATKNMATLHFCMCTSLTCCGVGCLLNEGPVISGECKAEGSLGVYMPMILLSAVWHCRRFEQMRGHG